jgi:hypothetical protein
MDKVGGGQPATDEAECGYEPPDEPLADEELEDEDPEAYAGPDDEVPAVPDTGDFCSTHDCIDNFENGKGSIVQCADGQWSQSGGRQGACSYHGGVGGE